MRCFHMSECLRILPKPSQFREQLVAFEIDNHRRRLAATCDNDSLTVFNIVEQPEPLLTRLGGRKELFHMYN